MLSSPILQPVAPGFAHEMGLDAMLPPSRAIETERARPRPDGDGPWIACDESAGVVEIHDARLFRRGQEAFCRSLVEAAVSRFGATRARVGLAASTCRLEFGSGRLDRAELARRVEAAIRAATPAVRPADGGRADGVALPLGDDPEPAEIEAEAPDGRHRLVHLARAGGSLTMAAAAIVLPGLPTLPFLIMTGRHAALASPRIERLLRRHPWSAALLAEDATAGPAFDWASLAKMLGLAALLAAMIWLLHPPLPVVLALELGLMAVLGLFEWLRSAPAELGLDLIA